MADSGPAPHDESVVSNLDELDSLGIELDQGCDEQESEWGQLFDDESQKYYYVNSATQETTWDEPGIFTPATQFTNYDWDEQEGDEPYDGGYEGEGAGYDTGYLPDSLDEEGHKHNFRDTEFSYCVDKVDEDPGGMIEGLSNFEQTAPVPKRWTDFGQSVIFSGVTNPSPFQRINVFKAFDPPRESFRIDEDVSGEWSKKMVFFVFSHQMPNTVKYNIQYCMNPYRNRLLPEKAGAQAKRDISRWNSSRKVEETQFYAYPVHVPGSQLLHVDWTSSPDRYKITTDGAPEWQWTRCFSFFGYTACKFHVVECKDPLSYKIVEGHVLGDSVGLDENGEQWNVILAFFAFKTQVPGTNKYYVQQQHDPHYRTRIGMEPSQSKNKGWENLTTFYAFDTAMPGTAKFSVQYTVRSTEAYDMSPEQFRIYTKDPWGSWADKFAFYAFPAEGVTVNNENGDPGPAPVMGDGFD